MIRKDTSKTLFEKSTQSLSNSIKPYISSGRCEEIVDNSQIQQLVEITRNSTSGFPEFSIGLYKFDKFPILTILNENEKKNSISTFVEEFVKGQNIGKLNALNIANTFEKISNIIIFDLGTLQIDTNIKDQTIEQLNFLNVGLINHSCISSLTMSREDATFVAFTSDSQWAQIVSAICAQGTGNNKQCKNSILSLMIDELTELSTLWVEVYSQESNTDASKNWFGQLRTIIKYRTMDDSTFEQTFNNGDLLLKSYLEFVKVFRLMSEIVFESFISVVIICNVTYYKAMYYYTLAKNGFLFTNVENNRAQVFLQIEQAQNLPFQYVIPIENRDSLRKSTEGTLTNFVYDYINHVKRLYYNGNNNEFVTYPLTNIYLSISPGVGIPNNISIQSNFFPSSLISNYNTIISSKSEIEIIETNPFKSRRKRKTLEEREQPEGRKILKEENPSFNLPTSQTFISSESQLPPSMRTELGVPTQPTLNVPSQQDIFISETFLPNIQGSPQLPKQSTLLGQIQRPISSSNFPPTNILPSQSTFIAQPPPTNILPSQSTFLAQPPPTNILPSQSTFLAQPPSSNILPSQSTFLVQPPLSNILPSQSTYISQTSSPIQKILSQGFSQLPKQSTLLPNISKQSDFPSSQTFISNLPLSSNIEESPLVAKSGNLCLDFRSMNLQCNDICQNDSLTHNYFNVDKGISWFNENTKSFNIGGFSLANFTSIQNNNLFLRIANITEPLQGLRIQYKNNYAFVVNNVEWQNIKNNVSDSSTLSKLISRDNGNKYVTIVTMENFRALLTDYAELFMEESQTNGDVFFDGIMNLLIEMGIKILRYFDNVLFISISNNDANDPCNFIFMIHCILLSNDLKTQPLFTSDLTLTPNIQILDDGKEILDMMKFNLDMFLFRNLFFYLYLLKNNLQTKEYIFSTPYVSNQNINSNQLDINIVQGIFYHIYFVGQQSLNPNLQNSPFIKTNEEINTIIENVVTSIENFKNKHSVV